MITTAVALINSSRAPSFMNFKHSKCTSTASKTVPSKYEHNEIAVTYSALYNLCAEYEITRGKELVLKVSRI